MLDNAAVDVSTLCVCVGSESAWPILQPTVVTKCDVNFAETPDPAPVLV